MSARSMPASWRCATGWRGPADAARPRHAPDLRATSGKNEAAIPGRSGLPPVRTAREEGPFAHRGARRPQARAAAGEETRIRTAPAGGGDAGRRRPRRCDRRRFTPKMAHFCDCTIALSAMLPCSDGMARTLKIQADFPGCVAESGARRARRPVSARGRAARAAGVRPENPALDRHFPKFPVDSHEIPWQGLCIRRRADHTGRRPRILRQVSQAPATQGRLPARPLAPPKDGATGTR